MIDLYSVYRLIERTYTGISRRLPGGYALPPLQMVIELTYRCNLRCDFCYQRHQMEQLRVSRGSQNKELSLEEIKGIVRQTPLWSMIILTGGEPFVRSDILDIVAYITKKRRCHIVNNGTRITPDIAHALVEAGVLSVGFSIDGDALLHDRVRGVEGTFERAMSAISEIRKHRQRLNKRWPLVNFKTTITEDNVQNLGQVAEIARRVGADYHTFQIVNNSLFTSGMQLSDDMSPYVDPPAPFDGFDVDVLHKQLHMLRQMQSEGGPKIRFSPGIPIDQFVAHYANALDVSSYTCSAPWSGVNVSAYGDVFPCFNYRIGNLRDNTLRSLWNGPRYRAFRKSLKQKGLFPGCVGCCDLVYNGE